MYFHHTLVISTARNLRSFFNASFSGNRHLKLLYDLLHIHHQKRVKNYTRMLNKKKKEKKAKQAKRRQIAARHKLRTKRLKLLTNLLRIHHQNRVKTIIKHRR